MYEILTVGSLNMDVVNRVQRHPMPGETVKGMGTEYHSGGKGANQAFAAAKAGARTAMFGAVGEDGFGAGLLRTLEAAGVETGYVLQKAGLSGMAFITVDESGENSIILSEGANGKLTAADADSFFGSFPSAKTVLLQNEIPWETTRFVMEEAKRRGMRVLFNPAPAHGVQPEILSFVDLLILNETEAETLSGSALIPEAAEGSIGEYPCGSGVEGESLEQLARAGVREAAKRLLWYGAGGVVVTLGEKGAYYADGTGLTLHSEAFKVAAIDTTAAGDTFIGALAASLSAGSPIADCLRIASAAAAIAVTRRGAQTSIPDSAEIEDFLRRRERGEEMFGNGL